MRDAEAGILASELRHVVEDLQDRVGTPIRDAWVPTPTSVILDVGRELLLIEAWPVPRVQTLARRPPAPPSPLSFQGLLRARFLGRLDRLAMVGDDRVVELAVGHEVLHARLFGRGGGIWLVEDGRVVAASTGPAEPTLPDLPAPRPGGAPRFAPLPGERWPAAAARFLDVVAAQRELGALRGRLVAHLDREHRREGRLADNLRSDLDRAAVVDDLRHRAACLGASLSRIPRWAPEVTVPDVEDETRSVVVPLVPGHPPSFTLGRLYERARRLERGAEQALERLLEVEERLRRLEAARTAAAGADLAALRALASTWKLPPEQAPRTAAGTTPWATWRGPHGEVAWVGRSDVANHALVFRHARARDWWVHVRDRPGAHVVLPSTSRTATPSLEMLLVAAQLALQAARTEPGERLDVQYARVGEIRAVKGGGPGRVTVRDERVLHVVSDPSRLVGWSRDPSPSPTGRSS